MLLHVDDNYFLVVLMYVEKILNEYLDYLEEFKMIKISKISLVNCEICTRNYYFQDGDLMAYPTSLSVTKTVYVQWPEKLLAHLYIISLFFL